MDNHKMIVCLSASPSNGRIIRTAASIAQRKNAELTALYVETPAHASMNDEERRRLDSNMALAGALGARTEIVYGEDLASRIAEYARICGAGEIVLGQSALSLGEKIFRPSLSDQLSALLPDVTLFIIPDISSKPQPKKSIDRKHSWRSGVNFFKAAGLLGGATLLGLLFQKAGIQEANIITLYILAVTLTSVTTGSWVIGTVNAAASVVVFNFFFTEPYLYFAVNDPGYGVTFVVMFAAAFLTGTLAARLQDLARQSAKKAYRTEVLLEASRLLQQESDEEDILKITGAQLAKLTGRSVRVYALEDAELKPPAIMYPDTGSAGMQPAAGDTLPAGRAQSTETSAQQADESSGGKTAGDAQSTGAPARQADRNGSGKAAGRTQNTETPIQQADEGSSGKVAGSASVVYSEEEMKRKATALWSLREGKSAGAWTEYFPECTDTFMPVQIHGNSFGVFAIHQDKKEKNSFVYSLCSSIVGECALAMENRYNEREREQAALSVKNEQTRSNLLRAISHDLRTPLTAIFGNASNLLTNADNMPRDVKTRIYKDIREDSFWLISVVENLLAVTRLENGKVELNMSVEDINDVVEEALHHADHNLAERRFEKHLSDEPLFCRMDARLMEQVIINLINNAVKYTPEQTRIVLTTQADAGQVVVSVCDYGNGVSDEEMGDLFVMFHTGKNRSADSQRGLGLGLSLCKTIVEAHEGSIYAGHVEPSGLKVWFTLPRKEISINGDI